MSAKPCIECGRRPKARPHHRCAVCYLRTRPIGEQVAAARRRLAMVPPELRLSRRAGQKAAPDGYGFCAGCQSFRDVADFRDGATRCRACSSASQHGAMIERTYGLTAEQYDELLQRQQGRCAVCRARPKSKRLAVDHDHRTNVVRGLLCSRCNHDLLGSAWDSLAMVTALWHYLNTPPTSGEWMPPTEQPRLAPETGRHGPIAPLVAPSVAARENGAQSAETPAQPIEGCTGEHYLPSGWMPDPERGGVFRIWYDADDPAASPF